MAGTRGPKWLHGPHDLGDYFAAAAEDDLTTAGDVIEQVVEVGAGLSAGDGSLAAGTDPNGRTESGPVAGGLGGADGDQYGGDAAGGLAASFEGVVVGQGLMPSVIDPIRSLRSKWAALVRHPGLRRGRRPAGGSPSRRARWEPGRG